MTTSFDIMKHLLTEAVSGDDSLTTSQQAELNVRVAALTSTELLELGSGNAGGTVIGAVVDEATDSIQAPDAVAAVSVIFDLHTFDTPVRVRGDFGVTGALIGTVGQGSDPAVAEADITLQYRLTTSGTWRSFGRNVVISDVDAIQFKVIISLQTGDHCIPKLWIVCEQQ